MAELLGIYSLEQYIKAYEEKFPTKQLLISVPNALVYFDDAEEDVDPISLKSQTWPDVKKFIQERVWRYP